MQKIPIQVLILPKFEAGAMTGDFPGEAQYFYEGYCRGGQAYEIAGGLAGHKLYVRDGVALYVTGMGKVNAVLSFLAVLSDPRFDFSRCYVLSVGCAGGAAGRAVMGDVFVISAAADYDLGHHADIRELPAGAETTWFHDPIFDSAAFRHLNPELVARAYGLVKDVPVKTTPKTKRFMASSFDNAPWAMRDPRVLRGTTVSGDNYWKGIFGHRNAEQMVRTYGCPDPFALSEMEDAALAVAADRHGFLDRFLIIRACVNMDVFMNGATPASLWLTGHKIAAETSEESADIFATAMENLYVVAKRVIDASLNGTL